MGDIKDWTTTADGMNAFNPPDAAKEDGTTVAQLNDCMREAQAATRRYYDSMEWRNFGYSIDSNGADTVEFSEAIPLFIVGQRVKVTDTPAGDLYGTITINSAQTLTIDVDGGATFTSVSAVEAGFSPTGDPAGIQDQMLTGVSGNLVDFDNNGDMADSGTSLADIDSDINAAVPTYVISNARTTYAGGDTWTFAHGQASAPDIVLGYAIKNATGGDDGGYSSGDKVMLSPLARGTANNSGLQVWANATNLAAVVGADNIRLACYNTSGQSFTMAAGEWNIYIEGVWF